MDGPTALKKAQTLSTRSFNSTDRRRYFEHLLTLPSYKSPTTSAYYASSITRDFTEFEDLQDQAVDAVLDLCEDENEQTRISGISALAEIGRVEPRWVRGNTGVLVQLLECPPGELSHVKKALFTLLEVSPSDVFSMMAEDCKSEEESGSRHNILTFLSVDAKGQRKEILESGRYVEAEHTFSKGFYDILSTTSSAETIQVMGLLVGLSTISGKNATRETQGKFAKTSTNSLRPHYSAEAIKLWSEFTKKAENLDPRWIMYFLAIHGAAVVRVALEKDDNVAKGLLEFTNTQTPSRWRRYLEDREDRDLEAKALIPRFAQTILEAALNNQSTPNITTLEQIFLPVYTLITLDRTTREYIPSHLMRKLNDFGYIANRQRRISKGPRVEQCWKNLRDMAEIMADRKEKAMDIRPSWTMRVRERSRSPLQAPKEPDARASASTTTTTLKDTRYAGVKSDSAAISRQPERSLPKVGSTSQHPRPVLPPPAVIAPPASTSSSTTRPEIPSPQPLPKPIPREPSQPPKRIETPTSGFSIKARAVPAPPTAVQPIVPMSAVPLKTGTTPTPSPGLSIRARATQTPTQPQAHETPFKVSDSAPVFTQGFSIRSASTPIVNTRAPSLLSRLSSSTTTINTNMNTNKRPRNDESESTMDTSTPVGGANRRSLIDRLGSNGIQSQDKRQKLKTESPVASPSPSLLFKMGSMTNSYPILNPGPGSSRASGQTGSGFALKRTGIDAGPLPPRITTPTQPTIPIPIANGLSIKNRSTDKIRYPIPEPDLVSQGISIKRAQPTPTPLPLPLSQTKTDPPNAKQISIPASDGMDVDAPVIRKGRGFAAKEYGEVLITPPNPFFGNGVNLMGMGPGPGAGLGGNKRQKGLRFGQK